MISYNDIYEASRKEQYSEQLQGLPKNFVSEVSNYLREKRGIANKSDDSFSEVVLKTKKQLENAITLFNQLMRRRRKKILDLILIASETGISKRDFDNMLDFEKNLFENLMKEIDSNDKKITELLNGEKEEEKQKNKLIVFKSDVEEFMTPEGNKMGKFTKGQIANLPNKIADILISDGVAEKAEEE